MLPNRCGSEPEMSWKPPTSRLQKTNNDLCSTDLWRAELTQRWTQMVQYDMRFLVFWLQHRSLAQKANNKSLRGPSEVLGRRGERGIASAPEPSCEWRHWSYNCKHLYILIQDLTTSRTFKAGMLTIRAKKCRHKVCCLRWSCRSRDVYWNASIRRVSLSALRTLITLMVWQQHSESPCMSFATLGRYSFPNDHRLCQICDRSHLRHEQ